MGHRCAEELESKPSIPCCYAWRIILAPVSDERAPADNLDAWATQDTVVLLDRTIHDSQLRPLVLATTTRHPGRALLLAKHESEGLMV